MRNKSLPWLDSTKKELTGLTTMSCPGCCTNSCTDPSEIHEGGGRSKRVFEMRTCLPYFSW